MSLRRKKTRRRTEKASKKREKGREREREREREQIVTCNKKTFITISSQSDSLDTIANLCAREEGCKNLSA